MAEIPGWAYLIVGVVVVAFSKFVESRSGKSLTLFLIAGAVFGVIGLAKTAYTWYVSKNKKTNHKRVARPQSQPQMQRNHPMPPMWQGQKRQNNPNTQRTSVETQDASYQRRWSGQGNANQASSLHIHTVSDETPADHTGMNNIIACPNCNIKHYSYAKFCMMCGYKIK